ncbi:MAG TPA: LLM class flavin-dependent oxidoreductase [Leptolyngbyaceae cyanobacterium]
MAKFGYHASHEQFKPSALLEYVQAAQQAGFTAALSSDHFHPWSDRQGESGFAWSWLGAAMQAGLVRVEEAKLYTRPEIPPRIIGAAITPETAEWLGGWADGLITISGPHEKLRKVVEAFHRGGGEGKPMYLKVQLSYAQDESAARQGAYDQWRNNIFENVMLAELQTPAQFDAAAEFVKPEDLKDSVRISADPEQHIEWLQKDVELGFSEIILHNVNRQQQGFIEVFGERVLPALVGS